MILYFILLYTILIFNKTCIRLISYIKILREYLTEQDFIKVLFKIYMIPLRKLYIILIN